jgi:hypothetical protein
LRRLGTNWATNAHIGRCCLPTVFSQTASRTPQATSMPRARLTPTVTPQVRETGRHCAPRPPSTVSRPQFQPVGRADDFECESVLCSSQRRAESNRAVVRVCGAALRQAACGKTKRHAAGRGPRRYPVACSLLLPCCPSRDLERVPTAMSNEEVCRHRARDARARPPLRFSSVPSALSLPRASTRPVTQECESPRHALVSCGRASTA